MNPAERTGARVLGVHIDALTWNDVLATLKRWARNRESRYICICNVHSVVTAARDSEFARVLDAADLATPDGMPVAWTLRRKGYVGQQRINGPDLMWKYCAVAQDEDLPILLYGGSRETLDALVSRLGAAFPRLRVAGAISPPFRTLSADEDRRIIEQINASGASVVFVALGCPRQEAWMHAHRGEVKAVMIGVGAAFDYHAGSVRRAPPWMQNAGLEWLYRLTMEPRRLWRRYLVTNTLFIVFSLRETLSAALRSRRSTHV